MEVFVQFLRVLPGEDDLHALFQPLVQNDVDVGKIQTHEEAAQQHARQNAEDQQAGGDKPDKSAKIKHVSGLLFV